MTKKCWDIWVTEAMQPKGGYQAGQSSVNRVDAECPRKVQTPGLLS